MYMSQTFWHSVRLARFRNFYWVTFWQSYYVLMNIFRQHRYIFNLISSNKIHENYLIYMEFANNMWKDQQQPWPKYVSPLSACESNTQDAVRLCKARLFFIKCASQFLKDLFCWHDLLASYIDQCDTRIDCCDVISSGDLLSLAIHI